MFRKKMLFHFVFEKRISLGVSDNFVTSFSGACKGKIKVVQAQGSLIF